MSRIAVLILLLVYLSPTHAGQVTFDFVTIGDPGNEADQSYGSAGRRGAVDYVYQIGKYEVTNDQYVAFLNAVDGDGTDPYDLYAEAFMFERWGGILFDDNRAHGAKYYSRQHMGNKPVNYVTGLDTMRFVNWVENGQPTDGSGTETGTYAIADGSSELREPGSTFFLPTEDEWYKAAYYDPRPESASGPPGDDFYWYYPTRTDDIAVAATATPDGDIANPGPHVSNHAGLAWWNSEKGNVTTVGTGGPESSNHYGTYDQGGNVWEWTESLRSIGGSRITRGGGWFSPAIDLSAEYHFPLESDFFGAFLGFRMARIPEPQTGWGWIWFTPLALRFRTCS